ncbi:Pre-mRNA-splicing factor RBM22 [Thelohanellus kitauei]|uniref:Pre-mRNA-splicing factor RBM22 n=1 Tax=Thelohanellus kitauei TaxID=669202 RepID=A0A0C2MPN6_THEKT|nr:Pre-mRNA-splicing factor RBM22 [Thelohanellus kitauei]
MNVPRTNSKYNHQHWEDSEFPILCQTCYGKNPYIRMLKDKFGSECKVCQRPFTTFKWLPGPKMRYKKTEICQLCAKLKHVCQTCVFDLDYGLPTQVRDTVMSIKESVPQGEVNKEYYRDVMERKLVGTDGTQELGAMKSKTLANNPILKRLQRQFPYYERNRPHLCSFWVKGECKRGEECPFRHEMPTDPNDPLSSQNIRDRYHGSNDPVANKILKKLNETTVLETPIDGSITTLYIGGVDATITKKDLENYFYQFGEVKDVNIVLKSACAFVTFNNRVSAEMAAEGSHNQLSINGVKLKVDWAIPQGTNEPGKAGGVPLIPVPKIPQEFPYPIPTESSVEIKSSDESLALAKMKKGVHYPSQDPYRLGRKNVDEQP